MRALNCDATTEEIEEELQRKGLQVQNMYKMTTKHRPLYLIITPAAIKLDQLVNEIKYLLHVRVY